MKDDAKQRKDDLAAHLRAEVLTLRLAPGADLDEAQLSARFGLSRTPLREVFRALAGEGYLELRAHRGARVSELGHGTLRDFFLAAPMIYGAVLRLAAQNRSDDQLIRLRAAQAEVRRLLTEGDAAARTLANSLFHEITGEMAGNIYLLPSFRRLLLDHARIGQTFFRPTGPDGPAKLTEAADQHDAMIAAIEARDEEAAAAIADAHWRLSRDQIAEFVMPRGLDIALGPDA